MTSRRSLLLTPLLLGGAFARSSALLRARPSGTPPMTAGLRALGIRKKRDAQLYVPNAAAEAGKPAAFLMFLHGATGSEQSGIKRYSEYADALGLILLSPASAAYTWDAIVDGYGPDVKFLDEALARAFTVCNVDASRVGVCGFSDGASYALGLGLANGELFQSVMAFSPGFVPAGFEPQGRPRVFVSHGTKDTILPIDTCSRILVPKLKRGGYDVTYREFEGIHTLPPAVSDEALRWFLNDGRVVKL